MALAAFFLGNGVAMAQQPSAKDQLGMAVDYFTGGKYHEARLLLEKLDKQYRLNPRYRAYLALSRYQEWDYALAADLFAELMPRLEVFAPQERYVYQWAYAESLFNMERREEAVAEYEKALTLCKENERPDVMYRLGLCHMFAERWAEAYRCYADAEKGYRASRDTSELKARLAQIATMKHGCEERMPKPEPPLAPYQPRFPLAEAAVQRMLESVKQSGSRSFTDPSSATPSLP